MVFIIQNRMSMNDYLYQYNEELNAEERQKVEMNAVISSFEYECVWVYSV